MCGPRPPFATILGFAKSAEGVAAAENTPRSAACVVSRVTKAIVILIARKFSTIRSSIFSLSRPDCFASIRWTCQQCLLAPTSSSSQATADSIHPALHSSASHQPLIPRERSLEVVVLLAADEADVFQMREVLLGCGRIAK